MACCIEDLDLEEGDLGAGLVPGGADAVGIGDVAEFLLLGAVEVELEPAGIQAREFLALVTWSPSWTSTVSSRAVISGTTIGAVQRLDGAIAIDVARAGQSRMPSDDDGEYARLEEDAVPFLAGEKQPGAANPLAGVQEGQGLVIARGGERAAGVGGHPLGDATGGENLGLAAGGIEVPSKVLSQKIAPVISFSASSMGQMTAETTWESWK